MKIRLVAYRKAITTSTYDSAYELDLQEAPNVSLNYQFSDIKNPETRKANYSQTFKLPFTDNNNDFFQNWYNVNIETLVYNTRERFNAVLYVGTVPQFEGFLQLKAVYQKAKYYEVTLISNTADLFTIIGEKRLKEVFKDDDGEYSKELNHVYSNTNIEKSWDGTDATFVNSPGGVSLQDATAGVQKVMYPMSITKENFFYTSGSNQYLDMSTSLDADYMVNINQLRPAIQIKTLFKLIFAKAGLSYTSSFIDGSYFGKLYMTTGNTLEEPVLPTLNTMAAVQGGTFEGRKNIYSSEGFVNGNPGNCYVMQSGATQMFEANDFNDVAGVWDDTNHVFTKVASTMLELTIQGNCRKMNIKTCNGTPTDIIYVVVQCFEWDGTQQTDTVLYTGVIATLTGEATTGSQIYQQWSHVIPLEDIEVGKQFRIQMSIGEVEPVSFGNLGYFQLLRGPMVIGGITYFSRITCTWLDYTPGQFNGVVDVPACIDPSITQKGFLKDIIERFNLVFIADPDNASNILVEPFNDYLDAGEIKDWTKKLDTSKEIIVKDTTTLQKRTINFTDKEDVDLMNKTIKEETPSLNVWGKYFNDKTNNDFATGELTNNPIFSPFINQQVFKNQDNQAGTDLPSMAVQYEISYKEVDFGYEAELKTTKPKLFYYSGSPSDIKNTTGTQVNIYLHYINPSNADLTAYSFNKYPLCSAWDITDTDGDYTLTAANKSLNWDFVPPVAPDLTVFNYAPTDDGWENNTLYYYYWRKYLDSIYSEEARIMECYLRISGVDIFNFKFNDEIFIKDCYWRIINIQNYQVGEDVSTKVTLLKIVDSLLYDEGVDYVSVGTLGGILLTFCPTSTPACTPSISPPNFTGLLADEASCYAAGGEPFTQYTAGNGLFPCLANTGSLPANFQSQKSALAVVGFGQLKSIISGKLGTRNIPLIKGGNTSKYSQKIIPYYADDMVIKFKTRKNTGPFISGENHRIILTGYQEGTTMNYAYPDGNANCDKIIIPPDTNMSVNVTGVSTVVGGTSSSYPVGDTEAFGYNTVFVSKRGNVSQIGTVGGILQYSIKGGTSTSALYITASNNELLFGIVGNQADTLKTFTLTADIVIQRIPSISHPHNANWALYQNYEHITLQNGEYLLWN